MTCLSELWTAISHNNFVPVLFFSHEERNVKTLLATNIFNKDLDYISIFKKQRLKHQTVLKPSMLHHLIKLWLISVRKCFFSKKNAFWAKFELMGHMGHPQTQSA